MRRIGTGPGGGAADVLAVPGNGTGRQSAWLYALLEPVPGLRRNGPGGRALQELRRIGKCSVSGNHYGADPCGSRERFSDAGPRQRKCRKNGRTSGRFVSDHFGAAARFLPAGGERHCVHGADHRYGSCAGHQNRGPSIDGKTLLRIPPGTQSGQKFRLRGKGAPSLRGEVRGNQIVEVRVIVPKVADERSKEILRELARLNPENPRAGISETRSDGE